MKDNLRDIAVLTLGFVTLVVFAVGPIAWVAAIVAFNRLISNYPP